MWIALYFLLLRFVHEEFVAESFSICYQTPNQLLFVFPDHLWRCIWESGSATQFVAEAGDAAGSSCSFSAGCRCSFSAGSSCSSSSTRAQRGGEEAEGTAAALQLLVK